MQSLILFFLLFFQFTGEAVSQVHHKLTGRVTDEYRHPLAGASVVVLDVNSGMSTDRNGRFVFTHLSPGVYEVRVSFAGYQARTDTVYLSHDTDIEIRICPTIHLLKELTVSANASLTGRSLPSLPVSVVDRNFIGANASGSLMQTLSRMPGVGSMDIGSSQSKPVIRGLGFNRVVVAENGIKHEAQEWGADHGLEIDQFNIDYVEVVKGPASLMYGSSAIGGVIDLKLNDTPSSNSMGGKALVILQSNNEYAGGSAQFFRRFDRWYFKTHVTYADYSDYRVPTDTITYMTYNIALHENRLRNTAGRDRAGSFTVGYLADSFSSHLRMMNNFNRVGFFANAHGLEIRNSAIDYDGSNRDIDLPSQQVNHLKVLSNSTWLIDDYRLNVDMAFQQNSRQEFSEAVSHGYMPSPPDSLERMYNKKTWNLNIRSVLPKHGIHQYTVGINIENQDNNIGGWGFLLPSYRLTSGAAFLFDNIQLSEIQSFNWGLRYDMGMLSSNVWNDWYLSPDADGNMVYTQRAADLQRGFGSLSWGLGTVRRLEHTVLKVNAGKSFRMPTAKELSSNGINYHMYRYERGDSTLKAEESYQLDFSMEYNSALWDVNLSPFLNYFPTYIYLNPTSVYIHAQQLFHYSQSQVFRAGAELFVQYAISDAVSMSFDAEYVYSRQLSGQKKGYTLPFSPPLTSFLEFVYTPVSRGLLSKPMLGIVVKMVSSQHNIVPPEKKTPGYVLFNIKSGAVLAIGSNFLNIDARIDNVLNTVYFDHSSFYRLIEVPGRGRNVLLTIGMNF